ncbi:Creatinase/aminopeptidase [Jaminaea rosea]|uniref:Creatinase/aminopeptidase n=1 Tax=Jaminaea rosea TaxID=1569628 RepID=A0A316V5Y9_9BASI|nr:Creatinase/aminopeptidase [Jaminaea rosea]PWN30845.1 Creatinase/aminopeptidase [Jaminaea rosea]
MLLRQTSLARNFHRSLTTRVTTTSPQPLARLPCSATSAASPIQHLQPYHSPTLHRRAFYSSPSRAHQPDMGAINKGRIDTTARVAHLRALMAQHEVQAYVIPSEDAHASEYPAECDLRRTFITGFNGSAGTAVVTTVAPVTGSAAAKSDKEIGEPEALLFTDGRYFLQAGQQLQPEVWKLMKQGEEGVPTWTEYITSHLPPSSVVGIDPSLLAISDYQDLSKSMAKRNCSLKSLPTNLIDEIWNAIPSNDPEARPAAPRNEIFIQPLKYAGKSVAEKVNEVRIEVMKLNKERARQGVTLQGFVATMMDEVAWLLNLRGTDVPYNPVFFGFAIVPLQDKGPATAYLDHSKLTDEAREQLVEAGVAVKPYESFYADLAAIGSSLASAQGASEGEGKKEKFLIGKRGSLAVSDALGGLEKTDVDRSPVIDLKSIKNEVELEGFRHCHIQDGAALANYFAWLEAELQAGKTVREYEGSEKLKAFRAAMPGFKGESFTTISSTGPNAAVIHYSPSPEEGKSEVIEKTKIYLCDSGAQFQDGTTDVTRTLHFAPSEENPATLKEIRTAFTRVLQGHIAIDEAVFPKGTTGYLLDVLARRALWEEGLDYRHGTGHGVGSYLNVHEGPAGIGTRLVFNETPLRDAMVLSNEPGFYKDGSWGIRIENLVIVRPAKTQNNFGGKGYFTFEHLTLCPIQTSLIDASLLSVKEKEWINAYHDEVLKKVGPVLEKQGKDGELGLKWLERECKERV